MSTKYNPGEYVGVVTTWGLGESKTKKTPQFILRFNITGKVNPNDPTGPLMSCPNYERTIYRAITKNTVDYLVEDLQYLGYDRPTFKDLSPESQNAFNFNGLEIRVRCEHEEYKGQVNERWSLARGGIAAEIEPLDGSRVRELDSLFGKTLKSRLSKEENIATAANAKPLSADEIPF